MKVDLKIRLQFTEEIVHMTLRPNIVIWSRATEQFIIVELTIPLEERKEAAYERKKTKYDELRSDYESEGWN